MTDNTTKEELEALYSKLLRKESESGKMRWNAICEDIINIYIDSIPASERLMEREELFDILFSPYTKKEEKKGRLEGMYASKKHREFFNDIVFVGIDDPKGWKKWVSVFRY